MPFDYFNTSFLAFGINITNAFKSLSRILDEAYLNIDTLDEQVDIINTYKNRNYKVGKPMEPGDPVRGQELYDILSIKPLTINYIKLEDGKLKASVTYFNTRTYILTVAEGERDLTNVKYPKGYIVVSSSRDNNNPEKALEFITPEAASYSLGGDKLLLCRYVVDKSQGTITLDKLSREVIFPYIPTLYTEHYKDLSLTRVTDGIADGYQAFVAVTDDQYFNNRTIQESANSDVIQEWYANEAWGQFVRITGVYYAKPGDKITFATSSPGKVYRINYITQRGV